MEGYERIKEAAVYIDVKENKTTDMAENTGYQKIQTESLEEFCKRWGLPITWGYSRTRLKGKGRLPHVKAGKYIKIIPQQADEWMISNGKA